MTFTFNTSVTITPFGTTEAKIRMSGNIMRELPPEEGDFLGLISKDSNLTVVRYPDVVPLHESEHIVKDSASGCWV